MLNVHENQLHDLARRSKAMGLAQQAEALFMQILQQNPADYEAVHELGIIAYERRDSTRAAELFRQAIAVDPKLPGAYTNLGNALREIGQFEDAVNACRTAVTIVPQSSVAHNNLALTLMETGDYDQAIAHWRTALKLEPHLSDVHWNMSLALLLKGNFAEGWDHYRWRPTVTASAPLWDGSPLQGKTIFLWPEQGFGDMLQFSRYVPLVAQRGGRVVLGVQPELVTIMRTLQGAAEIVPIGGSVPAFDIYCPLMNLPFVIGTRLESIPCEIPYLFADANRVADWKQRLGFEREFKVGIVWAGAEKNARDARRSLPLDALAPLADSQCARFYSLQKGSAAAQLKKAPANLKLVDLAPDLHDFSDTAAVIANLDLVISVDTAAAHLAGALGRPVWTLLPTFPDWRWMLGRSDSPWYPTMRLFRQPLSGDWKSVLSEVVISLVTLMDRQLHVSRAAETK